MARCLIGQARKSLWIETWFDNGLKISIVGQARKSLWIETIALHARSFCPFWSGS